jgi:hypothetical protein
MKNDFPISIWLSESKKVLIHCFICGFSTGIQVDGTPKHVIMGIDGSKGEGKPLQFPIRFNCKTKSEKYGQCRARYIIQGYVYPATEE